MEKRATLIVAILLGLCSVAWTQTLQMKVTYICNGERLIIDGCDIHDMSDTAHCFVAHPDRPLHNDMMAYTNETRGAMNKLMVRRSRGGVTVAEPRVHSTDVG